MKLVERVFIKKENIKTRLENIKNKITSVMVSIKNTFYIEDRLLRAAMIIGIFFIVVGSINNQLLEYLSLYTIICALMYISRMYNEYREQKIIDSIDIFKIGMDDDSLSNLIDSYIDDCFTRDVLFFRGINSNVYVNEKLENELRNELLNSVVNNMSPYVRTKLDYYYGKGRTDIIIGRKCFIKVAMFAATNNKTIYSK